MSSDVNVWLGDKVQKLPIPKKVVVLKVAKKCVKCGYEASSVKDLMKHLLLFEVTNKHVVYTIMFYSLSIYHDFRREIDVLSVLKLFH